MYDKTSKQRLVDIDTQLQSSFKMLSDMSGVPVFDINIRFKMLLPLANIAPFRDMSIQDISSILYKKLSEEVIVYSTELRNWNSYCGALSLQGCSPIHHKSITEAFVYSANGDKLKLGIKDVDEHQGKFIEKKIHYLHSFRKDAFIRKGLFVEDYTYPILYISIIKVCNHNKRELICNALNEPNNINIYEISRSVGCNNLPKNSISFMFSYVKKDLQTVGAHYLITAVNHFLGFDGASIKASGLQYLTDRLVDYSYTDKFSYIGPLDKNSRTDYYCDNTSLTNQIYYIKV